MTDLTNRIMANESRHCDECRYLRRHVDMEPYGDTTVPRYTYSCEARRDTDCPAYNALVAQATENFAETLIDYGSDALVERTLYAVNHADPLLVSALVEEMIDQGAG